MHFTKFPMESLLPFGRSLLIPSWDGPRVESLERSGSAVQQPFKLLFEVDLVVGNV